MSAVMVCFGGPSMRPMTRKLWSNVSGKSTTPFRPFWFVDYLEAEHLK
jgi:hypothetical protein